MIECPKCRFDNELGRIFCHQCGAKLDLDRIKAPTQGARVRRRVARGAGRLVRTLIELAVVGVLVLGIVSMCLVPDVKPVKPTNAELVAADTKHFALEQLVNGRKPGKVEFTESELNAYLNSFGFEKPKGKGFEVLPVTVRSEFGDGTVTVNFLGTVQLGSSVSKQIFLSMAGQPGVNQGSFQFQPTGAWIGRLPIHPFILQHTGLLDSYFGNLFGQLRADLALLDKASAITVSRDRAVISYQPPAAH